MEPVVRRDLSFGLSADALTKTLKIGEDFEDEFLEILETCKAIANPKYIYTVLDARQDGGMTYIGSEAFDSRIMRVNLEGIHTAYPYAVTCGTELYELALKADDPLERYWIDSISEHILYLANELLIKEIEEIAGSANLSSMNPGSLDDFPITQQRPLFRLLGDVEGKIGLRLTDSCLMLPYKSVSGIYYASDTHYVSCALCQRVNCPNRRAEFDETLFRTKYAIE